MSDSRLARMLGDAIAAPIRVASLLRESAAALDEVTGEAARDAAALALAATERTALSSAEAISTVAERLGSPARPEGTATVTVSLPQEGAQQQEGTQRQGAASQQHTPTGKQDARPGGHGMPFREDDDASAPAGRGGLPDRTGHTAHVHVRDDGRTVTYSAPQSVPHRHRTVNYDFFSGIAPEIRHPGGSLPGADRWDVPPDPQHPVPVVLAHGTGGGGQTNWGPYVPLLTGHGFSVFTLTYGALPGSHWPISAIGGMRRIEDSAEEFGEFAERVLNATGAERIDVVGHSQGSLVPAYWAKFLGGDRRMRRLVSLGPLWRGTRAFGALRGTLGALGLHFGDDADDTASLSIPQMITGSEFLAKLWSGDSRRAEGPYVKGIGYTNICTRYDEFVVPYTSGQVPGGEGMDVTNIVVQDGCPDDYSDHLGICGSRRAAAIVLNALDDVDQTPVPCEFVPPFFG